MKKNLAKNIKFILTAVAIIMGIIALAFGVSKFVLGQRDNTKSVTFYEYKIQQSEINVTPDEIYTGEGVTVEFDIDTSEHFTQEELQQLEQAGLSIEYQQAGESEWHTYSGTAFLVENNTTIAVRFVSDHFTGPITYREITNIAVAKIGNTT